MNRDVAETNMTERTVVAKRLICDYVSAVGGLAKVELTKPFLP